MNLCKRPGTGARAPPRGLFDDVQDTVARRRVRRGRVKMAPWPPCRRRNHQIAVRRPPAAEFVRGLIARLRPPLPRPAAHFSRAGKAACNMHRRRQFASPARPHYHGRFEVNFGAGCNHAS